MELLDVYDHRGRRTGKTIRRGEPLGAGEFHLIVHICIFSSRGELLIQQRQRTKKAWPGLWDLTVGGAAAAGEDSPEAAEREVLEEIGYRVDLSGARPFFTACFDGGFDDFYIHTADIDPAALRLQEEEVRQVRWASREQVLAGIEKGRFIPYKPSFIQLLFDLRRGRSFVD